MEPKGQVVGTPIYKQWVKSIGNKLDLWFVAAVGAGSLGKTALTYGIQSYLQVNSVKTELNCRMHSWHGIIAWWGGRELHTGIQYRIIPSKNTQKWGLKGTLPKKFD